jgi:FtsZ-binding cell division protein ZapB
MEFDVISKREAKARRAVEKGSTTLHDIDITEESDTSYSGFCKTCEAHHSIDKIEDMNERYKREVGILKIHPLPKQEKPVELWECSCGRQAADSSQRCSHCNSFQWTQVLESN